MLFRLARPVFRKNSSIPYFVQRIPTDVRERSVGVTLFLPVGDKTVQRVVSEKAQVVKVSLGTRDPSEAKVRQSELVAYLESVWQRLRNDKQQRLTFKQAVALAGEVYKDWTEAVSNDPGGPSLWYSIRAMNKAAERGVTGITGPWSSLKIGDPERRLEAMEERFGGMVDTLLASYDLNVDQRSRLMVLEQVAKALTLSAETAERYANSDYSPDVNLERFPEWQHPDDTPSDKAKVSINGLLDGWWREVSRDGGKSRSTLESYSKAIRYFVEYLGHDDASRVTPRDVVGYKDKRLGDVSPKTGKPISARTINDSELAGIRTVFRWGMKQHLIPSNPADGVSLSVNKARSYRAKGFTDEEAVAILRKALYHKRSKQEAEKTALAKRWVPWLCAYTGARVGEIVQLRKQDILQRSDHWCISISPEAFTVKSGKFREVPLHPHLVEQGFIEFVKGSPEAYLFVTPDDSGDISGSWQTMKNRLAEFARTVVTDERVKPNHGWRHRFITLGRRHDLSQELRRMITGHKGQGVDELDYGDPEGLYREINKLPYYEV
jgi:integrase